MDKITIDEAIENIRNNQYHWQIGHDQISVTGTQWRELPR